MSEAWGWSLFSPPACSWVAAEDPICKVPTQSLPRPHPVFAPLLRATPAAEATFISRLRLAADAGDITPAEIRQAAFQIEGLRKCLVELTALHRRTAENQSEEYFASKSQ